MPQNTLQQKVAQMMTGRSKEILKAWSERLRSLLQPNTLRVIGEHHLASQTETLFSSLMVSMSSGTSEDIHEPDFENTIEILRNISEYNARRGISPVETALFVMSLKDALLSFLQEEFGKDPIALNAEIIRLNQISDRMALATYEAFTKAREEIISQQNQTILELSTPTVRLWDKILMMPLIGVVDTIRASQIIETLLQAIVDTESHVAILDVTGVPIIDTQVAQHLMKTIIAAKMLGASVIVTGISPDMAQTMVKLDIDLGAVKTCGTLRIGVAEAFRIIGKKVV